MSELIQLGSVHQRPRAPRPDELHLRFSPKAIAELEALKTHYPTWKACSLPALWIAQREYGGNLTGEAIAEVAFRLERSYAEIDGVATFYSMYNVGHHVGRHKIEVCTCLTCHVEGVYRILDLLQERLGIRVGETTEDGMFTLHEVECLNACDRAPVIQVGPHYHGPVDAAYVDRLLAELRAESRSSVVQLADDLVNVYLRDTEREAAAQAGS